MDDDVKICYILVGVSGCGKSTIAQLLKNKYHTDCTIFSLDNCRLELFNKHLTDEKITYAEAFKYANENKFQFDSLVTRRWHEALKSDVVIVDNMNLTRKSRSRWVNDARSKGFQVIALNVMTPLSVIISRQSSRKDKFLNSNLVEEMFLRQEEVMSNEADYLLHCDGSADEIVFEGSIHFAKSF